MKDVLGVRGKINKKVVSGSIHPLIELTIVFMWLWFHNLTFFVLFNLFYVFEADIEITTW